MTICLSPQFGQDAAIWSTSAIFPRSVFGYNLDRYATLAAPCGNTCNHFGFDEWIVIGNSFFVSVFRTFLSPGIRRMRSKLLGDGTAAPVESSVLFGPMSSD